MSKTPSIDEREENNITELNEIEESRQTNTTINTNTHSGSNNVNKTHKVSDQTDFGESDNQEEIIILDEVQPPIVQIARQYSQPEFY